MEKWRVYLSVVLLVASIDPNFGTLSKSDKKHKVGTYTYILIFWIEKNNGKFTFL